MIEITKADLDYIERYANMPEMYDRCSFTITPERIKLPENSIAYKVMDDGKECGGFVFEVVSEECLFVHTLLTIRGSKAVRAGKAMVSRVLTDYPDVNFITSICPEDLKGVMAFAVLVGFRPLANHDIVLERKNKTKTLAKSVFTTRDDWLNK